MNLVRRSAWAVVMLGIAAGCTGEDESTAPAAGPAIKQAPSGEKKHSNPADNNVPSKDEGSKEMQPPPPPPEPTKKAEDEKKGGEQPALQGPKTEGKGDTAAAKLTPEEIATIKQLPAADQELALKQAVCPVSEGHLGQAEMGKPYKTTVNGRTVFLCCKGCEDDLKADPQKFLVKLDATTGKK